MILIIHNYNASNSKNQEVRSKFPFVVRSCVNSLFCFRWSLPCHANKGRLHSNFIFLSGRTIICIIIQRFDCLLGGFI